MTRFNEVVDRYVTLWNETDADRRSHGVKELFSDDAVYLMWAHDPFHGHDAINGQITYAHQLYKDKGFVFRSSNNAIGHHNILRFNWVMVSEETGEAEAVGLDVLELDDDGRIRADYQFIERPPAA